MSLSSASLHMPPNLSLLRRGKQKVWARVKQLASNSLFYSVPQFPC